MLTSPTVTGTQAAVVRAHMPVRPRLTHAAHILAVAVVLGSGVLALRPIFDVDIWWHLRTGQYVLDHLRVPTTNHWSFTADGSHWVTHEWLSETGMAAVYRWLGGLHGIIVFRSLGVLLLTAGLAVQCFRRTTPGRALACFTLAVVASEPGWSERPQLYSFVLLLVVAELIERARAGRLPLWALLPVTWLWANLHGLWFLGIALVGLTAVGIVLDEGRQGLRQATRFGVTAAGMAAAAALTPNGPRLLAAPLAVNRYARFVTEYATPSPRSLNGAALYILIAVVIYAWARGGGKVPRSSLLLFGFSALLGITYIRTMAPGAVLLAPIAASALQSQTAQSTRWLLPRRVAVALSALLAVVAVGAGGVFLALADPLPKNAPLAATSALEALPGRKDVINEYALGSWLIWKARDVSPAIDPRSELYPVPFFSAYLDALEMRGDWKRTVNGLHADYAWLNKRTPLAEGLRGTLHWHAVYQDERYVILAPPGSPAVDGGAR